MRFRGVFVAASALAGLAACAGLINLQEPTEAAAGDGGGGVALRDAAMTPPSPTIDAATSLPVVTGLDERFGEGGVLAIPSVVGIAPLGDGGALAYVQGLPAADWIGVNIVMPDATDGGDAGAIELGSAIANGLEMVRTSNGATLALASVDLSNPTLPPSEFVRPFNSGAQLIDDSPNARLRDISSSANYPYLLAVFVDLAGARLDIGGVANQHLTIDSTATDARLATTPDGMRDAVLTVSPTQVAIHVVDRGMGQDVDASSGQGPGTITASQTYPFAVSPNMTLAIAPGVPPSGVVAFVADSQTLYAAASTISDDGTALTASVATMAAPAVRITSAATDGTHIYVAGCSVQNLLAMPWIARFTTNGAVDTSFNNDGGAFIAPTLPGRCIQSLVVDDQHYPYALLSVGKDASSTSIARFKPSP